MQLICFKHTGFIFIKHNQVFKLPLTEYVQCYHFCPKNTYSKYCERLTIVNICLVSTYALYKYYNFTHIHNIHRCVSWPLYFFVWFIFVLLSLITLEMRLLLKMQVLHLVYALMTCHHLCVTGMYLSYLCEIERNRSCYIYDLGTEWLIRDRN